jgi:DNA-directed RNA polymerase specialized sigma24 family protein
MERQQIPHLLDERGQPLSPRVERLLRSHIAKLRQQFPALRNDALLLTQVLEEGGRRLERWEQQSGKRLDKQSHRFVETILVNIGRSWMLRDANRLRRDTIGAEAGETILSALPATQWGTAKQIEDAVRLREVHDNLTEDQWLVCGLKDAGYSAIEIAETRGGSPAAANMVFSRAKRKLRRLLDAVPLGASDRGRRAASPGAVPEQSAPEQSHKEADGRLTGALRLVRVQRGK